MERAETERVETAATAEQSELAPLPKKDPATFATRTPTDAEDDWLQNLKTDDKIDVDDVTDADELSQIKAKTMSNMVEDLPTIASQHGGCKLL